ncbi:hypothetical protein BST95_09120 [Halioglobus japonicus]|uniref:histidine kinase n=1 Tax=Halioglobus japonicus TaxID=930805 RepID=A0AAP8SN93_9GAMM|nr:ATP-binding protein [Halioglobus japonicus]AQA18371.1 hypothetical protein BST95_09120 [Halioglobus japonicus]PLW86387.1 hybrid sensor histidine kinase/response regulator [Halioglobus japonicus]GHD13143.1 hypothetical protein GCM10007052_14940 [Halioglobus japonicus]
MTILSDIKGEHHLQSLLDLFSVVMVLDRRLDIIFASDTLLRHMPSLTSQPRLEDVFQLVRPRDLRHFDEFLRRLDTLYLLTSRDQKFAIRGQLIHEPDPFQECLVFCGAPWLYWMNANCEDKKLGLSDFSHQDVQLDQLLYMASDASMVADLERLNGELSQAKEKLESAQAARNAFFSQMSHEMRTPLNGIISAMSLMQKEVLPPRAADLLELANKSSDHMLETINYVLDIAKLEAAEAGSGPVAFNLSEALESVIDIVRPRALEKKLDLRLDFNDTIPLFFWGDVESLRQVILNFLINAIKFTETGEIRIDVDRGRSEGMTLRLEVADTGIGIPLEAQPTIFEPFDTGKDANSSAMEVGSGLGLDIARRSVSAMGGDIGLISSEGTGSRFWIELPLEAVEAPVEKEDEVFIVDTQFTGRLLLVDDNETNLMLMSMILQDQGLTITTAVSGEDAVALVESEPFDLVFMDISMPGMDGYEATRRIRAIRDADALPVIALSAYTGDKERKASKDSGMNGYLVKPLEEHALVKVLAQYIRQEGSEAADQAESDNTPDAEASPSLADVHTVEALRQQIGDDNLVSVIEKFRAEVERRWPALQAAGCSEDLEREAHTLASNCGSFGLPTVAARLRDVESHARAGGSLVDLVDLTVTERELQAGVSQLCEMVRKPR